MRMVYAKMVDIMTVDTLRQTSYFLTMQHVDNSVFSGPKKRS